MPKKIILLIIFFLITYSIYSQGELTEESEIFYKDERSTGLQLNTNGWGLNFRRGYYVAPAKKNLWEVGFNKIRHPKEYKISNPYSYTMKRYVYGKLNTCYDIKFGFGRQRNLFHKSGKESVEIRLIYFIGPTLGILKPIYYEIYDTVPYHEKYKPAHQPGLILGRSSFVRGLSEIKINPGIYFKFGISFEHGKYEEQLRAIEIGFETSAYLQKMKIMAVVPNSQFFFTLFLTYRIGKVFHGGHHTKRNKKNKEL